MNRREREIWEAAAAVGLGMRTSLAWVALGMLTTPPAPSAPTPPIAPCPDCDGKGWRQIIHLSGTPDAETCPTCHNPVNHPCPWSLP